VGVGGVLVGGVRTGLLLVGQEALLVHRRPPHPLVGQEVLPVHRRPSHLRGLSLLALPPALRHRRVPPSRRPSGRSGRLLFSRVLARGGTDWCPSAPFFSPVCPAVAPRSACAGCWRT